MKNRHTCICYKIYICIVKLLNIIKVHVVGHTKSITFRDNYVLLCIYLYKFVLLYILNMYAPMCSIHTIPKCMHYNVCVYRYVEKVC